jgi:hypothetical protein
MIIYRYFTAAVLVVLTGLAWLIQPEDRNWYGPLFWWTFLVIASHLNLSHKAVERPHEITVEFKFGSKTAEYHTQKVYAQAHADILIAMAFALLAFLLYWVGYVEWPCVLGIMVVGYVMDTYRNLQIYPPAIRKLHEGETE